MRPLSTYRAKVAASDAGMRFTRALNSITALSIIGFVAAFALTAAL